MVFSYYTVPFFHPKSNKPVTLKLISIAIIGWCGNVPVTI